MVPHLSICPSLDPTFTAGSWRQRGPSRGQAEGSATQKMEAAVGVEGRRPLHLWALAPGPLGRLGAGLGAGGWEPQTHHPQAQRTTAHGRGGSVREAVGHPEAVLPRGEQRLSVNVFTARGALQEGCPRRDPKSCGGPESGVLRSLRAAAARPRSGGACRSGSTPCCSTNGRRGSP